MFTRDTTTELMIDLLYRQHDNGEDSANELNAPCAMVYPFDKDETAADTQFAPKGQATLYPVWSENSPVNLDADLLDLRLAHRVLRLI
jgi:hypothetical protein